MDSALEIARILLPIVLVGGIVVFVIMRMKSKYTRGKLGKKKSKSAQSLLDSLIPFGMILGCIVAILISIIFSIPLLSTISLGSAVGLLFGYLAYEIYDKMDEN